jgi:hypothetical protein
MIDGIVNIEERNKLVQTVGRVLSDKLTGFYGSIQYTIQNGKIQYVTVTETSLPEKQERTKK